MMKISALLLCLVASLQAATYGLAPFGKLQFFSNTGTRLSGGLVYTYQAGTSTPLATYTDSTGGTPNANPIVLDSAGRASIWLAADTAYKIVLQTSAGVTVWTADNVSAAPLDTVTTDTVQTITGAKQINTLTVQTLVVTGTCTGCGTGGGGGGGTGFDQLTSGTNITATMTVGSASTLQATGTGIINFGAAGRTAPAKVGTTAAIPATCTIGDIYFSNNATAGQNLYYCTALNTWTQEITGAGGVAFSAITGGTNSGGAAMLVGATSSLGPTSTGTIKATSVVDSSQLPVLTVTHTASAVDYFNFTNSPAGTPGLVSMAAVGTDTNITTLVQGKGSGNLQLNSASAYVDNAGNLTVVSCTGCPAGGGSTLPVVDTTSIVKGNADNTKQMRFALGGLTTATTRVITVQDTNLTMAGTDVIQTFTAAQNFGAAVLATASMTIQTNNLNLNSGADMAIGSGSFTTYASGSGIVMQSGSTSSIETDWLPGTTDLRDMGNASKRWNNGYIKTVSANSLNSATASVGTSAITSLALLVENSSSTFSAIQTHNYDAAGYGLYDVSVAGSRITGVIRGDGGVNITAAEAAGSAATNGLHMSYNSGTHVGTINTVGSSNALSLSGLTATIAGGSASLLFTGTTATFNSPTIAFTGGNSVNFTGATIVAPNGGTGLNGTTSCPGASRVSALTMSYGFIVGITCL